ncbi:unnamed protein product [Parnassius apollo]|uniref:(apollo) hypothetical protein n=1 Tax=Parnassius apollo TaxID=110799 RepID=A0A8S3W6R6_PARAO|nr:unnamed protein product [Parnassius apollo]
MFVFFRKCIAMGLPDLTEVRLERDVVQARMSEQALRVSSLSAQLARQRHAADALAHAAASDLGVQLHDATAEVQRLKEELESKDKQLARLKQNLEEKSKSEELQLDAHGDASRVEEKVKVVERSLISAQQRCAQLQTQLEALAADNKQLRAALQQRDRQLQDLMALKLEDDDQNQKSEPADGKVSGRTLSDIVSISEFDEQDLQMRRAELKGQNISLAGAPYVTATRDKSQLNRTLPLDLQRPNMSLLNLDSGEHFDAPNFTPRADSLPIHLTSTQNREGEYKRNTNETTVFGKAERFADNERHSPQNIPDNCSLYPNRDISDSKNVSVEPKKINFSLEASDNKTQDEDFTSLRELGISLDVKQENFPDILAQLKHELKKTRNELESCKSELKNAEEQLCEFPALKEEVEELKGLLENTMATMENDKKFYENQLENFSSNKKLLEQRLAEMTQEISNKTKDLHLLKEDILRRENMILELAKEKRNLTNRLTELEVKIDELQSRNETLEKFETETHQLKEKIKELQKLEQLVTEKNQQIDSLNQHLDRLDDLQRCLNDKTEEYDNLKEAFHEKSNELYQLQGTVDALNRDMNRISEENNELKSYNKELNLKLSKLEKEQENASLRLQNSENELERVNSMNRELTSKIEELKTLNEKLKDKETEIEILNEDINSYHNEIASLKEQLQMVSRSPSPRSKNGEDRKTPDRQASNDRKQLAKIRKQISLLQHELDFNKKELNDKAFELAKAKLDVTELRNNASQAAKQVSDKEVVNKELMKQTEALKQEIRQLVEEKQQLSEQLDNVVARLREESNVSEIKAKLREKAESCHELEMQLHEMRDMVDRREAARSPTAELERALRDQLHYSHALDDHIMDQVHALQSSALSQCAAGERSARPAALLARARRPHYGPGTRTAIFSSVSMCSWRALCAASCTTRTRSTTTLWTRYTHCNLQLCLNVQLESALRGQLHYSHALDDHIMDQLESALRGQLHYSHALDDHIMDQLESALRGQLHYSHALDDHIMDQLESALRGQLHYSHALDDHIVDQVHALQSSALTQCAAGERSARPAALLARARRPHYGPGTRTAIFSSDSMCSWRALCAASCTTRTRSTTTLWTRYTHCNLQLCLNVQLESALRGQLHYSHALDDHIVDQVHALQSSALSQCAAGERSARPAALLARARRPHCGPGTRTAIFSSVSMCSWRALCAASCTTRTRSTTTLWTRYTHCNLQLCLNVQLERALRGQLHYSHALDDHIVDQLESALRGQLHYSHALDDHIMDQLESALRGQLHYSHALDDHIMDQLESALRGQLHYSHALDDHIMDQLESALRGQLHYSHALDDHIMDQVHALQSSALTQCAAGERSARPAALLARARRPHYGPGTRTAIFSSDSMCSWRALCAASCTTRTRSTTTLWTRYTHCNLQLCLNVQLESALRGQLHYSHALDDHIMDQVHALQSSVLTQCAAGERSARPAALLARARRPHYGPGTRTAIFSSDSMCSWRALCAASCTTRTRSTTTLWTRYTHCNLQLCLNVQLESALRGQLHYSHALDDHIMDQLESALRGQLHYSHALDDHIMDQLERALRGQLHYPHALDDHIIDQILSASSDEREDIPRLALNTSKSSSSIHSTSSDRVGRLRAENEKLRMQVENLESRLKDKDALITELNRIRDKLVQDWQTVRLRYEAERDNSGRLQLLLDSQKETSESLQNQDSNMIQILKKRLESAMQSELELQEREQRLRRRVAELESALPVNGAREVLRPEMENVERLKGEISVLRSKLEAERGRNGETQLQLQVLRLQLDQRTQCAAQLRAELADIKRLKHDAGVELARTKELLSIQSATIAELEKKLSSVTSKKQTLNDTMGSVDQHTSLASPRPPGFGAPDDKNQALRYLHGRCVRLESWRKALVWQKRYLQRVLAGYARLDRALQPPRSPQPAARLFKCVGMAVVAVVRMRFLVRRREHTRRAAALLCTDLNHDNNLTNTGLAVSRNDIT